MMNPHLHLNEQKIIKQWPNVENVIKRYYCYRKYEVQTLSNQIITILILSQSNRVYYIFFKYN